MKDYGLCFVKENTAYFYLGNINEAEQLHWKNGLNWDKFPYEDFAIAPTFLPMDKVIAVDFNLPNIEVRPDFIKPSMLLVADMNQKRIPWIEFIFQKTNNIEFSDNLEDDTVKFWAGIKIKEFVLLVKQCGGHTSAPYPVGINSKTYVYADPHFNHQSILEYGERPFLDVEIMNEELVKRFNEVVRAGDKVYFLGDVGMGDVSKYIYRMNGYKILIMGNHDKPRPKGFWLKSGFDEVTKDPIILRLNIILSHKPMQMSADMPYLNVHGHIHQNDSPSKKHLNVSVEKTEYKPVELDKVVRLNKKGR